MAIENNRSSGGKDIPKGKNVDLSRASQEDQSKDQDPKRELPLSKYTHTKIILALVDLVPANTGYELTPGEIVGYEKATETGPLYDDTPVGREINIFSELDCDNPHNRDRAVVTTFMTFNEAYGLSDAPEEEKVLAKVVLGIDFDSGEPNERSAYLTLEVRENDTIGFDFATYGQTDPETTEAMQEEFSELGLTLDFEEDPRKDKNGRLILKGEFTEQQGRQLLNTLEDLSKKFNSVQAEEPQIGQDGTIAGQEETIAEFPKVGKKNRKTK